MTDMKTLQQVLCDMSEEEMGRMLTLAMEHLGKVLYFMAGFPPDDRCRAFDEALLFYNNLRPEAKVEVDDDAILINQQFDEAELRLMHYQSLGSCAKGMPGLLIDEGELFEQDGEPVKTDVMKS